MASVRLPELHRPPVARQQTARATPAGQPLLQLAALRPKARPTVSGERLSESVGPPGRGKYTDRMADGQLDDFPIFPLPIVLLPTEVVPLHIFEERYQA